MLTVEREGPCDAEHTEELVNGTCSHWELFDATYDAQRNEMVARAPSLGGYRLQFGWVPKK